VLGHFEPGLLSDLSLPVLNRLIIKFLNQSAAYTDNVIVVIALGNLENRPAPFKLMTFD
jgi:hypothetical protein